MLDVFQSVLGMGTGYSDREGEKRLSALDRALNFHPDLCRRVADTWGEYQLHDAFRDGL